jgi:hypothetical protein
MLVSQELESRIQEPGGRGLSKRWNWIGRDHPAATARPRGCLDCAQMAARPVVGPVGLRPGGTE